MTTPFVRPRRASTAPPTTLPYPRAGWAREGESRCASTCGDDRRCMLVAGHDGLHAWRSLGQLRAFEWT